MISLSDARFFLELSSSIVGGDKREWWPCKVGKGSSESVAAVELRAEACSICRKSLEVLAVLFQILAAWYLLANATHSRTFAGKRQNTDTAVV